MRSKDWEGGIVDDMGFQKGSGLFWSVLMGFW